MGTFGNNNWKACSAAAAAADGHQVCESFLGGSAVKESACDVGHLGSVPGLERPSGEGKGYPRQYSGLENSTDCIVHGVTKSWTRPNNFDFTVRI